LACYGDCTLDISRCYTPSCESDDDCPADEITYTCIEGDVYRDVKDNYCDNPGQASSACMYQTSSTLWDDCAANELCIEGNDECQSKPCEAPMDIMLVFDRSGTMGQPAVGSRLSYAKAAANTFVNLMNFSKDMAGVVSFNETPRLNQQLTSSNANIINAIYSLRNGGQTYIGGGIGYGKDELVTHGRINTTRVMILLSDGAPNVYPGGYCFIDPISPTLCTEYALNQSILAKAEDIQLFTIGLGVTNFTQNLLMDIASTPSDYYYAPTPGDLESIYQQIAKSICP
jgi:Mg-chelatase subunit ChlD